MSDLTLSTYHIWMIIVFIVGYALITLEHVVKLNKATIAILAATITWTLHFLAHPCAQGNTGSCIADNISTISQIVFFIWGALTIVELMSLHQGFKVLSDYIPVKSKRQLLWVVGLITFFLSSFLDNLTTTIVMVTLMSKLIERSEDRLIIGGGIVIAANAGGAWTPIGDVTTTMLWIGGQLSTFNIMKDLILPSMVCMVVSFSCLSLLLKGEFKRTKDFDHEGLEPGGKAVFILGVAMLIFVPIFKSLTGLPPFLGMLLGLSVLWIFTDIIHRDHPERKKLKVPYALSQIDSSAMLFFLGILLCIGALESSGLLHLLAQWLDNTVGNTTLIATFIGLASAVVDNVPLVAGAMGMYTLEQYPMDSAFWELVAYCAGTGGSILIIGSAAGVVFMSLEKVDFFWYLKRIGVPAALGFFAGIGTYMLI